MKKWYKSKTVLANVAVILAIIAALLQSPEILDLLKLLPEDKQILWMALIPAAVALINIILRFVTDEPIK